jgi:hypothetical protein
MTYPNCPCCLPDTPDAARGWHTRKGPMPLLSARDGVPAPYLATATWVDHPYRLRQPDGTWAYVTEPYALRAPALADLAFLADRGWTVTVSASAAQHLPGRTIAVTLTRPAPSGDAA